MEMLSIHWLQDAIDVILSAINFISINRDNTIPLIFLLKCYSVAGEEAGHLNALTDLSENFDLIPSTNMVACSCLYQQFHETQICLLVS